MDANGNGAAPVASSRHERGLWRIRGRAEIAGKCFVIEQALYEGDEDIPIGVPRQGVSDHRCLLLLVSDAFGLPMVAS
jgi:hypothetical protein